MPEAPKRRGNLLQFALIFAVVYLLTQFVFRTFLPARNAPEATPGTSSGIEFRAQDPSVKGDHDPILIVRNSTAEDVTLPNRCPSPPVILKSVTNGEAVPIAETGSAIPCTPPDPIAPGKDLRLNLGPWKYTALKEFGTYEAELSVQTGSGAQTLTTRFSISAPGPMTKLFRTLITKPFLNFLVLVASVLPDHNLGIAIIVLTVLVKLLLFFPTQHAMEGQRKMQAVQPKLDEIRRKFKDDPAKLQAETMRVWKEHGVNPFQSCLPTLIQFPILIGLFFVIRDGSNLALSRHLLYAPFLDLPWTFNYAFLGFDLRTPSFYVFPPLLVALQFAQMKLSFALSKRKQKTEEKPKEKKDIDSQKIQQQMMLYGLPLMIGFFALQFPTAVSLYWGVSTLFAIGQQVVVNRRT